jgi:hypothetical protein
MKNLLLALFAVVTVASYAHDEVANNEDEVVVEVVVDSTSEAETAAE